MIVAAALLQATVSFAAPADAAARLLPKMGAAMGLRLSADRAAGRQVLLVRVSGMDRNRLLGLVSDATGGAWARTKDGYRLTLGARETARLWKEETERRRAWVARALDDPKAAWAQVSDADRRDLQAVARTVGAGELAELRPGTRRVWSSSPRAGEDPLPESVATVARGMVARRLRLYEDAESKGAEIGELRAAMAKPPAECVLAARRGLSSEDVGLAFEVRAADGTQLGDAKGRIPAPLPSVDPGLVARMPATSVPFSKDVLRWAAVGAERAKAGPASLARFLHPEDFEPLALAVGPALEETTRILKADVVACLPDAAYDAPLDAAVQGGVGKSWPSGLARCGMDARIEGGALVACLAGRASAVAGRADRELLRRRIADVERDGHPNFRYSLPLGLEYRVLRALPADLYRDLYPWEWPWGPGLAWNGLSPAQQTRALAGGLPLREVPGFVEAFVGDLEPYSVRDEDESFSSVSAAAILAPLASAGVLRANIDETPLAVFAAKGSPLPETLSFPTVAKYLASPVAAPVLRDPGSAFYPGVERKVVLRLEAPGERGARYEAAFSLTLRTGDVPTHYPDLFPALSDAIRKTGG